MSSFSVLAPWEASAHSCPAKAGRWLEPSTPLRVLCVVLRFDLALQVLDCAGLSACRHVPFTGDQYKHCQNTSLFLSMRYKLMFAYLIVPTTRDAPSEGLALK